LFNFLTLRLFRTAQAGHSRTDPSLRTAFDAQAVTLQSLVGAATLSGDHAAFFASSSVILRATPRVSSKNPPQLISVGENVVVNLGPDERIFRLYGFSRWVLNDEGA
jgi:hypothetical protein